MEPQQVVIDRVTLAVKRVGFCDFALDGSFDPVTEAILTEGVDYMGNVSFEPPLGQALWTWDGSSFVQGADIPIATLLLRSPDNSSWKLGATDLGVLTLTKI